MGCRGLWASPRAARRWAQTGTIRTMQFDLSDLGAELAAAAARLVVEEGLEYASAKRQAVKLLGLARERVPLPDNAAMDAAVREHIAIFCADTQPLELRALRDVALVWLERLAEFSPYLGGAVWHGTATRHSDVYIQLFRQRQPFRKCSADGDAVGIWHAFADDDVMPLGQRMSDALKCGSAHQDGLVDSQLPEQSQIFGKFPGQASIAADYALAGHGDDDLNAWHDNQPLHKLGGRVSFKNNNCIAKVVLYNN